MPGSAAPESVESRFVSSTVAAYASQLAALAIKFTARWFLARLVVVEGHGVYELALRACVMAGALRDLGLPYHLMRDRAKPYGTVLAFTSLAGSVVTVALVLVAPAFAVFDEGLPPVLRVYAIWVLLDGLAVVPRTFFDRELRIGRLLAPEIGRALVMAALSIFLAYRGWGVWSFVAGDLASTAVFAAWVWIRAAGQMPLKLDLGELPRLLRESRLLFLIWLAVQAVTYVDAFILGGLTDAETVGYYTRAYWIAFLMALIAAPRALLPALVEYRNRPRRFALAFRVGTLFLMASQVLAGYFLFFNADKAVAIILGDQWGPAVVLVRILCFVPFLDVFTDLGGEVLKVRHEDRTWLAIVGLNLVSLVGFGILFTRRWGAVGMAMANFLLLGNLWMARRMAVVFGADFRRLMRDLAWVYLLPLPLYGAVAWTAAPGSWLRFGLSALAAAAAAGILALRFRQPYRELFSDREG